MKTVLDFIIEKLSELGLSQDELELCKNEMYTHYQHSKDIDDLNDDYEDYLESQLENEFRLVQEYLLSILHGDE